VRHPYWEEVLVYLRLVRGSLAASLAAVVLAAAVPRSASAAVAAGARAPAFILKQPGGGRLSIASLRGKVVFLDFYGPT
jgi:hypothetical protein